MLGLVLWIGGVLLEKFEVEELLGPIASGVTEPFLCRLSDGEIYVVKGKQATARGLVNEVICGVLGINFGLPIPPIVIGHLDVSLVTPGGQASASLGHGFVFASRYQKGLLPVTPTSLKYVPQDVLKRLFLFDYWVKNEDRTLTDSGGNPNLFIMPETRATVIFDHNLAFDPAFDMNFNWELHVARNSWSVGDLVFRDVYTREMEEAMASLIDIEGELPDQWLQAAPHAVLTAMARLEQYPGDEFWQELL